MTFALVMGGSSHLGGAITAALVEAGATVAAPGALDGAEPASIRRAIAEQPTPDAFISALTTGGPCVLEAIDDDEWRRVHDVNVRAPFIAIQALVPRMAERGSGEIVLTAALDGIASVPSPAHFAASQAALLGMTRALAKEIGPRGVRVNLVVIGVLDGGVAAALPARLIGDYKKFSALGRTGTAAEAARAVRWLALENRYMTGQTLSVTGGI